MKILLNIILFSVLALTSTIQGQNRLDALKRQGQYLMREGRYEEAVDQLNKYIAANPRIAEGYHLRGLCFEKRIQYQYSVLDLRRARRLDPANNEIKQDLDRVIAVWHKLLYQKIDGHKRDIAIDPNYAFSYLEIGKSYRWLEEWRNAEDWYDEYLKRDDNASPDEIIRYTEILAKTGSIIKGERILKKYTQRYPDDWRIWSRYGYFTLWLGKFKVAEDAFKSSLGFKPYFKEAEDGLDLAKRQGYLTQYQGRAFESTEYPIDRYYRILNQEPENDQIRFDLINELITANRYEEAYQQLQYLSPTHQENEKYKTQYKLVTEYRDSTFNRDVDQYTGILKNNPSDKEAVLKLSSAYGNLYYYDSAIEVLSEYLQDIPEDQDLDARFKYSQYCAWNYEWEKAIAQIDKLLKLDPNNLDYQLLRGQIGVWTVNDLHSAEKYLLNVINNRPNELNALTALISLYAWQKNFPEAKKYLEIAKQLYPKSFDVESAENDLALHQTAYDELKVFEIRGEAEKLSMEGKCDEALLKYDEYISKRTALSRDELIAYAAICSCSKNYSKAIDAYSKALDERFDFSIALLRAKNYYLNNDSTKAIQEFDNLSKISPDDDEARLFLADMYALANQLSKAEEIYRGLKSKAQDENQKELIDQKLVFLGEYYVKDKKLDKAEEIFNEMNNTISNPDLKKYLNQRRLYLGDAYVMAERYGDAKSIYKDLLESAVDTSEQRMVKERISWLPPSGIGRGLSSIGNFFLLFLPTNVGLLPFSSFYLDNQKFQFWNYGMRLDAGFIGFLSVGASWARTNLSNSIINRDFTQFKGLAAIFFSQYISLTGSYGVLNIFGEPDRKIGDAALRYAKQDEFSFILSYENNDARMILYSPNLIPFRINANYYRLNAFYNYRNLVRFSGYYNYFNLGDNNEGNDLQIRLGKRFLENGIFGYEYYFSDFAFISSFYYSPQNFDSHNLWTEWNWAYKKYKIRVGGKIGYVPSVDFIISEIFGEVTYNPIASLILTGRLGYGNSFRYDSSYKNYSASIIAYWGVF